MKSSNIRCLFALVLMCLFRTSVCGQDSSSTSSASRPTLSQLKVLGAQHSRYRNQTFKIKSVKAPKANVTAFQRAILPVLKTKCVDCHGPETKEGNIRIDTLDPDMINGNDVNWWLEVLAVLSNGEMPPADADKLSDKDRTKIIDWLSSEIQVASIVRRAEHGHSSFRRLTRYEYNYALQDLLGLPFNFAKDLPPESHSEDGFQNSSEMLHMSAVQFATYRELGRNALNRVTVTGDQPAPIYWAVSMKEAAKRDFAKQDEELKKIKEANKDNPVKLKQEVERFNGRLQSRHGPTYYKELTSGRTVRTSWRYPGARYAWKPANHLAAVPKTFDTVAIIPPRQKLIVELGDRIPERGTMLVRIRASRVIHENEASAVNHVPSLQLEFGWQASNDSHASVRVSQRDIPIAATPDAPQVYSWHIPLSEVYPRNGVRNISKMGDLPSPSEYVKFVNSADTRGDVQIYYIEVIAPVYNQWPPASHRRIFIDSKNSADEASSAKQVLTQFMPRAWRRPVSGDELDRKLALFKKVRPACKSFEQAMIEVLSSVIASPRFLYVVREDLHDRDEKEPPSTMARLSDLELATRLSLFLWCSGPDDELRELATSGKLSQEDILKGQVHRLLKDQRSSRFANHFVRQWLGMQLLDYLKIDRKVYRQYDPLLKEAMQREPIEFFQEVLRRNHSVLDFLHADYAMINERLARHYGMKNVHGNYFRRVKLTGEQVRGGLLTQAGLLAMNSDGKDSHPLKRGIWMLERLLNDPPPPPPPAVPEIDLADPKILKLTLKQRIENHRNQPACLSCHAKIDPWGIAFENFDAVGAWRTQIGDKPVDATSELFNKQKLNGMDGLKRFLLQNRQDQFARALVHKMMTFALGRPLSFGDRSSIDQITADLRKQGDGLATMIRLIVLSDLFQAR